MMLLSNTQNMAFVGRSVTSLSTNNQQSIKFQPPSNLHPFTLKADLQNAYSKNLSTGKLSSLGSSSSNQNKMTLANVKMHEKLLKHNLIN